MTAWNGLQREVLNLITYRVIWFQGPTLDVYQLVREQDSFNNTRFTALRREPCVSLKQDVREKHANCAPDTRHQMKYLVEYQLINDEEYCDVRRFIDNKVKETTNPRAYKPK